MIVDIPEEHADDLTQWAQERRGNAKPWYLTTGRYGTFHNGQEMPSLQFYIKMQVARTAPGMLFPNTNQLEPSVWQDMAQAAADSSEWMNEGYLDDADLPNLMRAIAPALRPRPPIALEDATAKTNYLRTDRRMQDLPRWDNLSPSQQALIDEAFTQSNSEWQQQARLNSLTQDILATQLRAATHA